ncbi:hypothetical protein M436DRAFT_82706 [Aureobasidium namibiae CBS 147.97]|uniref:Uncharacterized protein n=1 Tax=Aureobasidium namibiae CBS 147.97 TaxID=1043004 RepID=A0A074WHQ0_9PEZI|nr:uncharacterized protein M436DRAFT_82706 [Aureobasidium namibiae CBS 147.97]KEQ72605.1 hypothetical protein M436DRAFT_82706 [Aureobasidium namibiae CBS 147.97]
MPNPFSPHGSNGPLRQNAVLLSVLAASGAGYWLIKSSSLKRDKKRQEQIYTEKRKHIDTTKSDH